MNLQSLLASLPPVIARGDQLHDELLVTGASSDSRTLSPGQLFIAYAGEHSDGSQFLPQAFAAGAVAAVVSADADIPNEWIDRCIRVTHLRRWAALASARAFGDPSEALLTLGVTGTNGKTSSAYLLKTLLETAGHRVLLMTTVSHEFAGESVATPNTTPDAPVIQSALAHARDAGATAAVVEVSAHGVALDRITGTRFDGLLFTNLSEDHLDTFETMEQYYQAKAELFTDSIFHKPNCVAAIGINDIYGERLANSITLPRLSFGEGGSTSTPDLPSDSLVDGTQGITGTLTLTDNAMQVQSKYLDTVSLDVASNLQADFNRANIAGAAALMLQCLPDVNNWREGLKQPVNIPGRLNVIDGHTAPFRVVVDFAHTGEALANLLQGLRASTTGRLITVFGAGGDRDPRRRQSLPQAVVDYGDVGVITLDNPRSEDPQQIIDLMVQHWQVALGSRDVALHVEPNRVAAIHWALAEAGAGDTVILAGKGHETGQQFADRVEPHSDSEVASSWLENHYPLSTE